MTSNERIERSVSLWLREDAVFRVPDHLNEVLSVTRETRQRPAWSSLERWLPMDTTFRPRLFTIPRAGRLVLVAALILLVLAIAILAVGSLPQRLPEPFGLARNGIFVTSRDGDLYVVDPVTADTRLLPVGQGFDFSPIFSRDGTRFSFLRSDGPITEPAILTLYVANADGSNVRAITPPTESIDWWDWSPDGTHIAYVAKGQLWVADVARAEPVRINGAGRVHFPTWLPPDGKEIVVRSEGRSPAVWAIPADGTGERRPLSKTPGNNEFDYQSIALSPDGTHLTFTRWSDRGPDGRPYPDSLGWLPRVHSLDIATGTEVVFPTPPGTGNRGTAVYSPDGKLVAYARIYREGAFQMIVANADGSDGERTMGDKHSGPPDGSDIAASWAFTPDGTALLVRYGNDNQGRTELVPLDGSPATSVVDAGKFEFIDVQRLAP